MSLLKSSRDVTRSTFDWWPEFYDSSWMINKATEWWDNYLLELPLTEPVLDLGCATGRLLRKFTRKDYSSLFGLDISHSSLKVAGRSIKNEKVSLAQGFLERLPYKDASFSTVILSGVLHHLENPLEALEEIARILNKQGLFIMADPDFFWGLRHVMNLVLSIYPVFGDRRYYPRKQAQKLAENAGFRKKDLHRAPLSYILIFEKC